MGMGAGCWPGELLQLLQRLVCWAMDHFLYHRPVTAGTSYRKGVTFLPKPEHRCRLQQPWRLCLMLPWRAP